MTERQTQNERLWEKGWEGHEKAQLLRLARLSLEEKIKWLEEAQEIVENMERRKSPSV